MAKEHYLATRIQFGQRRRVAFIERNDGRFNAIGAFESLLEKPRMTLETRFDYWIAGSPPNKKWFHGFDAQPHRACFVFKVIQKNVDQRFYGFLCNPDENNARFRLCVLAIHATKTERETDVAELDRIVNIAENRSVAVAIQLLFRK